jgi:chromosome segregation ATPase
MRNLAATVFTSVLLFAGAGPSSAQTARSASPSAQAMQQLQQLASERTQLQAEVSKLKTELEGVRRERDSLKAAQDGSARRSRGAEAELARSQADKARVDGELAREKQRVEELVARFRETAATVRDVESDRAAKTQQLALREQELKVCTERNGKLYELNQEILTRLEDQGFWSALARKEPFTQLKRAQLQNLADTYRDTARDNRVPAPAAAQ